jgi:hypothetical protein
MISKIQGLLLYGLILPNSLSVETFAYVGNTNKYPCIVLPVKCNSENIIYS